MGEVFTSLERVGGERRLARAAEMTSSSEYSGSTDSETFSSLSGRSLSGSGNLSLGVREKRLSGNKVLVERALQESQKGLGEFCDLDEIGTCAWVGPGKKQRRERSKS